MRSLNFIALAAMVAFVFSSCKKEIDGSGKFVTQNRTVPEFEKVTSSGDFNVILKEDSVSYIVMYGEDNILPEIKTEVDGKNLKLYFDHHHYNYDHNGVTITIYNPVFKSVDLQGSGKISGSGELHPGNIDLNISGSGKIDLQVNTASVNSKISGSGSIYLSGDAPTAFHKISGSGNLYAFNLESADADVTISGSGKCRVYVTNKLTATISGSGDVIYRGNPIVTTNISGSGQVKPE